jgi:uncharacterized protein (DUF1697 family)
MDRLRKSLESVGFEQVQTYIQSGNVIFKTAKLSPATISKRIEDKILADFGFPVSVITRTANELAKAIQGNPFLKDHSINLERLHVTFLSDMPSPDALKKLAALTMPPDKSCCSGKELYLYLPNGMSESSLMKSPLERTLSVITTTRNWKTINSLHKMCQDCR